MPGRRFAAHHLQLWLLLAASLFTGAALPADQPVPPGSDWLHVGGDAGGSRYSTLDQINTKNVWRLERAWTWRLNGVQSTSAPPASAGSRIGVA